MTTSAVMTNELTHEQATQAAHVARLTKDLRVASATLSRSEARFLVDYYYITQDERIRAAAQVRSLMKSGEPHDTLRWLFEQSGVLEAQIKNALHAYAKADPVGRWSLSITGIGPVIAAGLLAYIEIDRAKTPGHIWRFAGLDPTTDWKKGQKRPWNAGFKVLTWKIGESFVKTQGRERDYYGKEYAERKLYEQRRNDRGELAEQAAAKLDKFKIGKNTEAYGHYSAGRLPPAHVHARAKRWAVKLFLSHWWEVAYVYRHGSAPPAHYVLAHVEGHTHKKEVPNWPH